VTPERERELRAMVERYAARVARAEDTLRAIRSGLAAAGAPNTPVPRAEAAELLRLARAALGEGEGA
jgi:hypothetical protein